MKVRSYATLRQILGTNTVDILVPEGITVRQLIAAILRQHPSLGPALLDEKGELHEYIHVFVNGRDVPYFECGLDTALTSNDTLDIFPPTAGG